MSEVRSTHYGGSDNPFEAIKIIKYYDLGFCLGNVIKYVLRYTVTRNKADLKKAHTYLGWEIGED